MIDDATSQTYARFYPPDTTAGSSNLFGQCVNKHVTPSSQYLDQHSIYRDEDHPETPTPFGRSMRELGLELIQTHSPQAKGRVERRNAVFQDRPVKELRLRNNSEVDQANCLLAVFSGRPESAVGGGSVATRNFIGYYHWQ